MTGLAGALSVLETLSQYSIAMPALVIAALIAGSLLFLNTIQPCFDCRDFKAVALHEVGHLLSLEHLADASATNGIPLQIRDPFSPQPPPSAPLVAWANFPGSYAAPYHTRQPLVDCRDPVAAVRVSTAPAQAKISESSVMRAFGSTALDRPGPGEPSAALICLTSNARPSVYPQSKPKSHIHASPALHPQP